MHNNISSHNSVYAKCVLFSSFMQFNISKLAIGVIIIIVIIIIIIVCIFSNDINDKHYLHY